MSDDDELSPGQIKEITAYVDIEARPPDDEPTALILSGTNQAAPAVIAAGRYHHGLAPLLIATGGINRHNYGTTRETRNATSPSSPTASRWPTSSVSPAPGVAH